MCACFEGRRRSKFKNLMRPNGQEVKVFLLELQNQAAKCNFWDQLEIRLREHLIALDM